MAIYAMCNDVEGVQLVMRACEHFVELFCSMEFSLIYLRIGGLWPAGFIPDG